MHVAVDKSGSERSALGIDRNGGTSGVDVFFLADCMDYAVDGNNRVGVENWTIKVSAQEHSDISDQ
jgi:hypothetical protein